MNRLHSVRASRSARSLASSPDRGGEPTDLPPDAPLEAEIAGTETLTYEPFYGLAERPFAPSADPRFFYSSRSHAAAFDGLLRAIRRRESLMVVTGDIGTGKSTLCRAVLSAIDQKMHTAVVPDPYMSREDLLKHLLLDFGVISADELRRGRLDGASRSDLTYSLREFLGTLRARDACAVLVIDGAQNLLLPLLEEIRVLSDLEDAEKLLHIVLLGQLELRSLLKQPHLRLIDQRLAVRCELRPLVEDEVEPYIAHRLAVAGGAPACATFTAEGLALLHATSGGVPRLVNLLCDRALHRGAQAGTARIGRHLVADAIDDLDLGTLSTPDADDALQFSSLVPSPPETVPEAGVMRLHESDLVTLLRLSPSAHRGGVPVPTSAAFPVSSTAIAPPTVNLPALSGRLWRRSWAWFMGTDEP